MQAILASRVPLRLCGLAAVLSSEETPELEVAFRHGNGRSVVEYGREHGFDLAVLEFHLDELNGLDVARELVKSAPQGRVILLLEDPQPQLLTEAVELGVCGIVHSECRVEDLQRAVLTVLDGQSFLCPVCTTVLVEATASPGEPEVDPVIAALTPREREVLQLIAEGLSSTEVARRLNISSKTVDTHRRHIMRKLDADSVAELVKSAIRSGLTTA